MKRPKFPHSTGELPNQGVAIGGEALCQERAALQDELHEAWPSKAAVTRISLGGQTSCLGLKMNSGEKNFKLLLTMALKMSRESRR